MFEVTWDFPSVDPPAYLQFRQLNVRSNDELDRLVADCQPIFE